MPSSQTISTSATDLVEITRIVAIIDRTTSSMVALQQARRLAVLLNAHLAVVHVFDEEQAERVMAETKIGEETLRSSIRDSFSEYMQENEGNGDGLEVEIEIGHLSESVVRRCHDGKADLLVIGADDRNEGGLGSEVLVKKRARHSPVEVLVCRPTEGADGGVRRVVACVDFSWQSMKALEMARKLAVIEGAEFHALHVAPPAFPSLALEESYEVDLQARLEALTLEFHREHRPECHVITASKPSRAIVSFLRLQDADLVVVGRKGRSELDSMLMGSTTERLVESAPCSVLTVKP